MGASGHELVAAVMKIAGMAPVTPMEGAGVLDWEDHDA